MFVFPATAWTDETEPAWDLKPGWFPGNDSVGQHPGLKDIPLLSPQKLADFLAPDGDAVHENGVLVVYDDAAACARAEKKLQQLVDAQLGQAELRVNQTTKQPTSVVQPLLANMQSHVFIGTERAIIGDHEVEIAENANISNPVVFTVRSGVWSRAIAHPIGRTWNMEGMWVSANQRPLLHHRQIGKPPMSLLLPDYEMSTWPWDGQISPDKPQALAPTFSVELRTQ